MSNSKIEPPRLAGPAARPRSDGDDHVERVRGCLKDLDENPAVVREAIEALSQEDLSHFGFRGFYLNLLAVLGDERPADEVARMAAEAARYKLWKGWEFFHHLGHCDESGGAPRLERFEARPFESLLERGRGLVVCSLHLGSYRDLPIDMARVGLSVLGPLDTAAHRQWTAAVQSCPDAGVRERARTIDVESGGSMPLARHLARRGTVFSYLDGNTGRDGPLGTGGRTEIELFGYPVAVKHGIVRLAARFGTPLLPVAALGRPGERDALVVGSPIVPPGRLRGADEERFTDSAVRRLYATFEEQILKRPEQWETGCFFHRWRACSSRKLEPPTTPIDDARRELHERLAAGRILRMNRQRIVPMAGQDEITWTDAKTLRAIKAPPGRVPLFERLMLETGGVSSAWLEDSPEDDPDDGTFALLAQLAARGALIASEA